MSSNKKESKKPQPSNTTPVNQVNKQKTASETKTIPQQNKAVDNNTKQKTVSKDPSKKDIKSVEPTKQEDPKANESKKQIASTKKLDLPEQGKQKQKTQLSQKAQQKQKSVQQISQFTQKESTNSKPISTKKLDKSLQKTHTTDDKRKAHEEFQQNDDVLKMSGILDAYEQFLKTLCKYGLPTGDVYQFAAQQIQKFERKKRTKQLKLKAQMEIQKAARKKSQLEKQKEQKKQTKL